MNDSKAFWLQHRETLPDNGMTMGPHFEQAYLQDPRRIAFVASRYKFASKILEGKQRITEVGCGDGWASPIVAQTVGSLLCTDIDEEVVAANSKRMAGWPNLTFSYGDFRAAPLSEKQDGIYLLDVIEHVFAEEEAAFVKNIADSLTSHGVCLVGTPNLAADAYASEISKKVHVNLKDHKSLRSLLSRYFENVFLFSMNDEVVHTGFAPMAHYLWALGVTPKR